MWKLVYIISNPYGLILDGEAFLVYSKSGIFFLFFKLIQFLIMIAKIDNNEQIQIELGMWKLVYIISNPYGFILDGEAFLVYSKSGNLLSFFKT